jgi:hypothetical protein
MTDAHETPPETVPAPLPPAAKRALAEAAKRRRAAATDPLPTELGGRDGPEPVRYGDWEKKGIATDF